MFDEYLIKYCAPTLASIKTANLFAYYFQNESDIVKHLDTWNLNFKNKGIELIMLKKQSKYALVYVFRRTRLQNDLNKFGVAELLYQYGYECTEVSYALHMLKTRLHNFDSFPHEIGLFLDYPLEDVIGFIENSGRNCKFSGFWKVYGNVDTALQTFESFKKCRDAYEQLWQDENRSILQLTV